MLRWAPLLSYFLLATAGSTADGRPQCVLSAPSSQPAQVQGTTLLQTGGALARLSAADVLAGNETAAAVGAKSDLLFDVGYLAACLCTFVLLPRLAGGAQLLQDEGEELREGLPRAMPALASLRYIAILVLWLNHEWMWLFTTSRYFAMLSGFVLHFAEERRRQVDTSWAAYATFLRRRVAKLYPLFALHVVVGYLGHLREHCDPVRDLLVIPNWGRRSKGNCGNGSWFISVVFACYAVFPFLSYPLRRLGPGILSALVFLCITIMALTLDGHNSVMVLSFSRMSVPMILPSFFLGMVLARAWVLASSRSGYDSFCQLGCHLSPLALGAAKLAYHGAKAELWTFVGLRTWTMVWQCVMLLSFAGTRASQVKERLNVPLWALSGERLAWLGELALPLYMTNSMACVFVNRLLEEYTVPDMGWPGKATWKYGYVPGMWVFSKFMAQAVVMHTMAWMIWKMCSGAAPQQQREQLKAQAGGQ